MTSEIDSRIYRHLKCGGITEVEGFDYTYVSNIFDHPEQTYCSQCDDHFDMREFCWDNTDEVLTDYYSRYASKFSEEDRQLVENANSIPIALAGTLLGGILGYAAGSFLGILAAIGGALVGACALFCIAMVIQAKRTQRVCQRVLGTTGYSKLN